MAFRVPFSDNHTVFISLFSNVENSKHLKSLLMEGSISVAMIKPAVIIDTFHVLSAANKALYADMNGKKMTKTLHSEILYCLSPTKSISDCFRRFGIGDKDSSILVVEITKNGQSNMADIKAQIKGDETDLCKLGDYTNEKEVKSMYKINDLELEVGTLSEAAVTRIATKEFITAVHYR